MLLLLHRLNIAVAASIATLFSSRTDKLKRVAAAFSLAFVFQYINNIWYISCVYCSTFVTFVDGKIEKCRNSMHAHEFEDPLKTTVLREVVLAPRQYILGYLHSSWPATGAYQQQPFAVQYRYLLVYPIKL